MYFHDNLAYACYVLAIAGEPETPGRNGCWK